MYYISPKKKEKSNPLLMELQPVVITDDSPVTNKVEVDNFWFYLVFYCGINARL